MLSNYVNRTKKVIDFLSKQSWGDQDQITLFGHSLGTKVAIVSASRNKQALQKLEPLYEQLILDTRSKYDSIVKR